MEIPMKVAAVMLDPNTQSPVVVLKEEKGEKFLPIWIGHAEATAIVMELDNVKFERPLTHDLIKIILTTVGVEIKKIVICDLKNSTYFANIYLKSGNKEYVIDSRPSDAIAIALRFKASVFVDDIIFDKSKSAEFVKGMPAVSDLEKKIKDVLDALSEEDFGKYKM